ncbi:autophagy- protein 2, partial [Coemansia sp. RSA 2611]
MWPTNWSFSLPSWVATNSLQKRLVKFLLRRTVGQFLKTELDDENLDVQLSGGQLRLRNIELSEEASAYGSRGCSALNDAIAGLPVEVGSGTIGLISVSVPWTQLWTGHCEIQIDELVIKSRLVDEAASDESPDSSDMPDTGDKSRMHPARSTMAESIAMTEGGASILTSSVFIADDFLRAETLGYGEKDEIFINKDVERLIATAHEERARLNRSRGKSVDKNGAGARAGRPSSAGRSKPLSPTGGSDDGDDDVFEDSNDALPMPGSPGGAVQGLQVVSEMVDRIISAVNIRVQKVTVECAIVTRDKVAGDVANTLQLTVDSIELLDEKAGRRASSHANSHSSSSNNSNIASGHTSSDNIAGSSRDNPTGTEYKVIEFRTLHKLLEIKGLRLSMSSSSSTDQDRFDTVLSTFGAPISAHARIHRRMPFSELAPVHPRGTGREGRKFGTGESAYMGPMPGEFREAKPVEPVSPTSPTNPQSGIRVRNQIGEEPTTSGWDVEVGMGDIACVVTKEQLASIIAIVRLAAPLVKQELERQAMLDQYQEQFGSKAPAPPIEFFPQLARWISASCQHIYVAVVPDPDELLNAWHESSLAVLRLKLEAVKHLALYLKGFGARWESTPPSGTRSAPSESAGFMDTDFWAAMTREATARTEGSRFAANAGVASGRSSTTFSACLQSFNLYDSSPEHHPVVLPLLSIDRALGTNGLAQSTQNIRDRSAHSGVAKHDIWIQASESDLALTINVAPIVLMLNKELVDRLSLYQELISSIVPAEVGDAASKLAAAPAQFTDTGVAHDVAESIERLMGNLKLEAEQRMPSNIAVCSPLIRTWIKLPGTTGDEAGSSRSSGQMRSRSRDEQPAAGHFCIDAVDAVITNVVNGTATSSQSPNTVPEGHMRHPHIQELLESRKSVGGSGVRIECEALHVYVQTVEGGSAIEHIGSVHQPLRILRTTTEAVSIPRPHIEITTVANRGNSPGPEHGWFRPPAFDAFSAVNDNIRVRMAPESELTTSLEFEQQAISSSRVVISCHLPESDISLSRTTYQRLNAVVNDFLLWQSIQEESKSSTAQQHAQEPVGLDSESKRNLGVSVLVDVPLMTARINSTESGIGESVYVPSRGSQTRSGVAFGSDQQSSGTSQRFRLDNSQVFLSNSIVEKGRVYVSAESNQVRLSSFTGDAETEVVLSHTFATSDAPMITPQLSLFLLTSPTISEESEVVLKTTWTTFDYHSDSACFRELEAFFSSSGTSGMVQPPPKPMRLSLNVQNSSFRWEPTAEPTINSAVVSVDSLAVILGINSPAPDRDNEELRYYIEGLSVFGRSADSQSVFPVDVSSDAWVSTGRFWKDHGYAALVHMDMIDVASKSKEGEDGPLVDLRLYSEALVVDACADSVGALPQLAQSLLKDVKGSADKPVKPAPDRKRSSEPRVLGKASDNIFGDIEEDAFASAPDFRPGGPGAAGYSRSRLSEASRLSSHSTGDRSFTYDFENGRDDIGVLVLDDYFATQEPPDVAEEYEVVGGQALSPTSPMQPAYSKRAQPIGSGVPIRRNSQSQRAPTLSPRVSGTSASSKGQSLDTKPKGKGVDRTSIRSMSEADDLGLSDDIFDLHDYVDMDSTSDVLSGDESDHGRTTKPQAGHRDLKLQSRFAVNDSVVLEPDFPASKYISRRPQATRPPKAGFIDLISETSRAPVKITTTEDNTSEDVFVDDSRPEGARGDEFEIIDDYFQAPMPGEASPEDSGSDADGDSPILSLTVDIARAEVNLHSGQDWFAPAEAQPASPHIGDMNFNMAYMDSFDDAASLTSGVGRGRTSASMPEYHGSPLGSPQPSRRPAQARQSGRRSAKPKIELRVVHVHAEYRQYAEASATAFDAGVSVEMMEILDQLETSEWSKFLTRRRDGKTGQPASLHLLANARNRQLLTAGTTDADRVTGVRMRRLKSNRWADSSAEPMVCLLVEAVRPYAALATQELRIDVEISPLRCYIHQDALSFLIGFFEAAERHGGADKATASPQAETRGKWGLRGADRPYFQIVRVAPINVIFDYKPRRMRAAPGGGQGVEAAEASSPAPPSPSARGAVELLNLFPLEDAEMTLSTVKVRGVGGVARLVRALGSAWLPHLAQTQIPGVVSGVAPLRSLVNLGTGVADLVILPLEQYRRDGRLVQGVRRGAQAFARTTALEAIQLGAKVAVNAQTLLEQAGDILNVDVASSGDSGSAGHSHESMLSPGVEGVAPVAIDLADWPDSVSMDGRSSVAGASEAGGLRRGARFGKSKYATQPENLSDGVRQAYASLRSNVGDAVQTILAIPVVVQEDESGAEVESGRSPVHGSVRAVVRAVPVAVLKPMIGATEAVSKTLLGLRNTMEPARRGQLED